jgi:hypothetical protein
MIFFKKEIVPVAIRNRGRNRYSTPRGVVAVGPYLHLRFEAILPMLRSVVYF